MRLGKIADAEQLLDRAFSEARKSASGRKKRRERTKALKDSEINRVIFAAKALSRRLIAPVKEFPSLDSQHPFTRELIEAIVDAAEVKKALSRMNSVSKIITQMRIDYVKKIRAGKTKAEITGLRKEFYGRVSSLVKSLVKAIEAYNRAAVALNEMPSVDHTAKTIILAGFPNVGKTTLLEKLTGSKAEIATYPFTTKQIMLGYFYHRHQKFQVIDTPGLLDRKTGKRNKIERKAIAALKHLAGLVVFVLDASSSSGFTLEEQLNLLDGIRKEFPEKTLIVAISKADLADATELHNAKAEISEKTVIEGKGLESSLKQEIVEALATLSKAAE